MSLLDAFLIPLQRSPLWPLAVLRGSQLSASWFPGRGAADLDFLIEGEWTAATMGAAAEGLRSAMAPVLGQVEVIWAETADPGVRLSLTDGFEELQVDLCWGDPLALPAILFTLRGVAMRAAPPEMMFAWKVHSLVEHGPRGRWHAKTLADLVLFERHLQLDSATLRRCIEAAFANRHMPLSELDGFFDEPTWGRSRGSRNKWKSYAKKAPWVDFTLEHALATSRERVAQILGRALPAVTSVG